MSFDVFGTCLVRSTAFDSDVFKQIALYLRARLEPLLGSAFPEDFTAARINAEVRAFHASPQEEVTLDQIWHQLGKMIPGLDEVEGKQMELALERRLLRPNSEVLTAVKKARENRCKVVFTSDTYLPADFIRECLSTHGFAEQGDCFYVSSEVGLTKRSGNLFKHLITREQVSPSQVTHIGDNPHSDWEIPQRLGISVKQVINTQLSPYERSLFSGETIDPALTSKVAGGMRIFRLQERSGHPAAHDFVSEFLGPVVLTFAAWAVTQARADGRSRLYFLSRDCYLLHRVAEMLAPSLGGMDCRYLQVSRHALRLPSVSELSISGMPWITTSWETPLLDRILAKLEIDVSKIDGSLRHLLSTDGGDGILRSTGDWDRFWALLNHDRIRTQLQDQIAHRRRAAMAYFSSQGLMDETMPWALVDLGWYLTCQTALGHLLGFKKPGPSICGYYLGLKSDRNPPAESGSALGLFYELAPDKVGRISPSEVFYYTTILEHLIGCAPHGTVRYYELDGDRSYPVCGELSSAQKEIFADLERLCLDFCRANLDLAKDLASPPVARHVVNTLVKSCFSEPKAEWINYLRTIEVATDQNNRDAMPLARPYTWTELVEGCLPVWLRDAMFPGRPVPVWPQANLAIAPSLVARCARRRDLFLRVMRHVSNVARSGAHRMKSLYAGLFTPVFLRR